MATKVIKTCDKCGKEVTTGLARIDVKLRRSINSSNYNTYTMASSKDICEECLLDFGFTDPADKSADKVSVKDRPTLEDKLIDILQDLGVSFNE